MKFKVELNNIELGEVKIGGITVQTELSINEMVAIRKESEHILDNIPNYLDKLSDGAMKFRDIDKKFDKLIEEDMQEDLVRQAKQRAIMDSIVNLFNK